MLPDSGSGSGSDSGLDSGLDSAAGSAAGSELEAGFGSCLELDPAPAPEPDHESGFADCSCWHQKSHHDFRMLR